MGIPKDKLSGYNDCFICYTSDGTYYVVDDSKYVDPTVVNIMSKVLSDGFISLKSYFDDVDFTMGSGKVISIIPPSKKSQRIIFTSDDLFRANDSLFNELLSEGLFYSFDNIMFFLNKDKSLSLQVYTGCKSYLFNLNNLTLDDLLSVNPNCDERVLEIVQSIYDDICA